MKIRTKTLLLVILLILMFIIIYMIISAPGPAVNSNAVKESHPGIKEPPSEIKIYFCPDDMCQEKMLGLIESSVDIKCAFYELNLPEMISALKKKNAQVVIEDSTYENSSGFYTGFSQALMHNKFCVFDNLTITTGSMNPTNNDNYLNNNNLVILNSNILAQNYLDEFSELKNNIYGKGGKVKTHEVYIGDAMIENYFCPDDNCKLQVINALKSASSSIYFMTFSFTDEDIGNLVWNKQHLGLDVKGIFDESQISEYSRYEDLKAFSIIDLNKYKLHDKIFIIDNETVITGSFNPTNNANKYNDENLVIIHDRGIAEKYAAEFQKLYNFKEKMPIKTNEIVMGKVLYDPAGSDDGNEFVQLINIGTEKQFLGYFSISDNKSSMRLDGVLMPNSAVNIYPKFSLKNSDGVLLLRHNADIVDFVAWEGQWDLNAGTGEFLERMDLSKIGRDVWKINKV